MSSSVQCQVLAHISFGKVIRKTVLQLKIFQQFCRNVFFLFFFFKVTFCGHSGNFLEPGLRSQSRNIQEILRCACRPLLSWPLVYKERKKKKTKNTACFSVSSCLLCAPFSVVLCVFGPNSSRDD